MHASVNQHYGKGLPYAVHLDMVAEAVEHYADLLPVSDADVLPVYFAAYYHDSIEDARQTYNDVMRTANRFMTKEQAYLATEIVYALTNEKGRTRAERANERYYEGIRLTPYAPFVKLADRLANTRFSFGLGDSDNLHMRAVYAAELPHFLQLLRSQSVDPRLGLPADMVSDLQQLVSGSDVL